MHTARFENGRDAMKFARSINAIVIGLQYDDGFFVPGGQLNV